MNRKKKTESAGGNLISGLARLGLVGAGLYGLNKFGSNYKKVGEIIKSASEFSTLVTDTVNMEYLAKDFYKAYSSNTGNMQKALGMAISNSPFRNTVIPNIGSEEDLINFFKDKRSAAQYFRSYINNPVDFSKMSNVLSSMGDVRAGLQQARVVDWQDFFNQYGARMDLSQKEFEYIKDRFDLIQKKLGGEMSIFPTLTRDSKIVKSASIMFSNLSEGGKREYILDFVNNGQVYVGRESDTAFTARNLQNIADKDPQSITLAQARNYALYPEDPKMVREGLLRAAVYDNSKSDLDTSTLNHYFRRDEIVYYDASDTDRLKFGMRPKETTGLIVNKTSVKSERSRELMYAEPFGQTATNPRQTFGYREIYDPTGKFSKYRSKHITSTLHEGVGNYWSRMHLRNAMIQEDLFAKLIDTRIFGNSVYKISGDQRLISKHLLGLKAKTYKPILINEMSEGLRNKFSNAHIASNSSLSFENWLAKEANTYLKQNPIHITGEKAFEYGLNRQIGSVKAQGDIIIGGFLPTVKGNYTAGRLAVTEIDPLTSGFKGFGSKATYFGAHGQHMRSIARAGIAMTMAEGKLEANTASSMKDSIVRFLNRQRNLAHKKGLTKEMYHGFKRFQKTGLFSNFLNTFEDIDPRKLDYYGLDRGTLENIRILSNIQKETGMQSKKWSIDTLGTTKYSMSEADMLGKKKIDIAIRDAITRGYFQAKKDPKIAEALSGLGFTLDANKEKLIYGGELRDPRALYDELTGVVGKNKYNFSFYNEDVSLGTRSYDLGFGREATISRPVIEGLQDVLPTADYKRFLDEIQPNLFGYKDELMGLIHEQGLMELKPKEAKAISLSEFLSKKLEYMPEDVVYRKPLLVQLPLAGSEAVVIPSTLFKNGIYIDNQFREIHGEIESSFNRLIKVAEQAQQNPTYKEALGTLYQEHMQLYRESIGSLINDKLIGGKITRNSNVGQVAGQVLRDTEWNKITQAMKQNPKFAADIQTKFGKDFIDLTQNPSTRQYLIETSRRNMKKIGAENASLIMGWKFPNYRGSNLYGMAFDVGELLSTAREHSVLNMKVSTGADYIGLHERTLAATLFDKDMDPMHMFRITNEENRAAILQQIKDSKSNINLLNDISIEQNKILFPEGRSVPIPLQPGAVIDEAEQLYRANFLKERIAEFETSFKKIGQLHNTADIVRGVASRTSGRAGLVLGASTKLMQETFLKIASKGAAGAADAEKFLSNFSEMLQGGNVDKFLSGMDEFFDVKDLGADAKAAYSEIQNIWKDQGLNIVGQVREEAKAVKSFKKFKSISELIAASITGTSNKSLQFAGDYARTLFPEAAESTTSIAGRGAFKDMVSEVTALAGGSKKLLLMAGAGLLATSMIGGEKKKVNPLAAVDRNPLLDRMGNLLGGKPVASQRPVIVQGNMSNSANLNATVPYGRVGRFVNDVQDSVSNLFISDNSKKIYPEDVRDMVNNNNMNSWNRK